MSDLNQYKYARRGTYNRSVLDALYNVREIIPGASIIALFIAGMGASQYVLTNYYRDGWKVCVCFTLSLALILLLAGFAPTTHKLCSIHRSQVSC